jgi:L-threonylcarbamoyladenylate synthase
LGLLEAFVRAGCKGVAAPKTHEEFAWVLYSALRAADEQGLETVVVEQPVGDGIVVAIRDRLKRASHQANESRM